MLNGAAKKYQELVFLRMLRTEKTFRLNGDTTIIGGARFVMDKNCRITRIFWSPEISISPWTRSNSNYQTSQLYWRAHCTSAFCCIWMSRANNLPNSIGELKCLLELDLSEIGITELPDSVGNLKRLKVIKMNSGKVKKTSHCYRIVGECWRVTCWIL